MSAEGKRRALKDVRSLFKTKEEEYKTPVSRLAGYVIQQVFVKSHILWIYIFSLSIRKNI